MPGAQQLDSHVDRAGLRGPGAAQILKNLNSHKMDQQNVKVVLRCRPMSASEKARDKAAVQCMTEKNVEVTYNSMGKSSKKQFCFDGVFDEKTTQKDFYDKVVRNVVDEVLQVIFSLEILYTVRERCTSGYH